MISNSYAFHLDAAAAVAVTDFLLGYDAVQPGQQHLPHHFCIILVIAESKATLFSERDAVLS